MNQHAHQTQIASRVTLALALMILPATSKLAAAACQDGRFVVHGASLIAADVEPDAVVVAGASAAIRSGCNPVHARVRVIHGRKKVRASWLACGSSKRKVSLRAEIDADCRMTGMVLVKHPRSTHAFVATRTACGDGIVDPEAAEECDDGNQVGGDGCEADCTVSPPRPTTTTTLPPRPVTTTTTIVPSTTTTTIDVPPPWPCETGCPGPDEFPPGNPPPSDQPPLPF